MWTQVCSVAGPGLLLPHTRGNGKPTEALTENGSVGSTGDRFSTSHADAGQHGRRCSGEESELFLLHFVAAVLKK